MSETFLIRNVGSVTILDVTPDHMSEFDFRDHVRDDLLNVVAPSTPIHLIINLSDIKMIGSHAIGVLIDLQKAVDAHGGQMKLCGVAPNVRMTLQALNLLNRILEVHDSEASALAAFD